MRNLKKLALVLGVAGASVTAMAANVNLVHNNVSQGSYSFNSMDVASNGTITVHLAAPLSSVPENYCGQDTVWDGSMCISDGPLITCGTGTTLESGVCIAEVPDLTPPTLNITSSPASLGDGVSSSTITFQFSRAVTGFAANDVSVNPSTHSLSGFNKVDADTWKATLNRSGNSSGAISVSVNSGSYQSTSGAAGVAYSRNINLVGGSTNIGECEMPNGVELNNHEAVTGFGLGGSIIEFFLPKRPTIWSAEFTTTGDSSAFGSVNMGGTTATVEHTREMWISKCPGGKALEGQSRCSSVGQDQTLRWAQRSLRTGCSLETNTKYYFNIAYHPDDESSCTNTSYCETIVQHVGGW